MGRLVGIAALLVAAIVVWLVWGGGVEAPLAGGHAPISPADVFSEASAHDSAERSVVPNATSQREPIVIDAGRPGEAASRRLTGRLVGPSGGGIPGGIITILHPARQADPAAFEAVADNRGAFAMDVKLEWFPSGYAYLQASGRASGLFEGFVPVREGVIIHADVDESSDAWVLEGHVALPEAEPQWVVNVLSRPAGAQPDMIASSMFENPYSGRRSHVRVRFVDRARLAWEGPVWLSVCRPGQQALVASRHFGSMNHLREALSEGVLLESVHATVRLPQIEAEWPIAVALLDAEYAFGFYPATGREGEWVIRASPGAYRLRATTASRVIAEARIELVSSGVALLVGGWDSVQPGSCSLGVVVGGEWSARAGYAQVDMRRLDPSTGIAWPYPVRAQAIASGVVLHGLHPGAYQLQLIAKNGRLASQICSVSVPAQDVLQVTMKEVGRIVCSIKDEWSLGPTAAMNSKLAWRADGTGSWNVVLPSPIASEGLVVPNVPLDQAVEVIACGSSAGGLAWIAKGRCRVSDQITFLPMNAVVAADLVGRVRAQEERGWDGVRVTIEGVNLGPASQTNVSAAGDFRLRMPMVEAPLPQLVVSDAEGRVLIARPLTEEDMEKPIEILVPN